MTTAEIGIIAARVLDVTLQVSILGLVGRYVASPLMSKVSGVAPPAATRIHTVLGAIYWTCLAVTVLLFGAFVIVFGSHFPTVPTSSMDVFWGTLFFIREISVVWKRRKSKKDPQL